MKDLFTVENLKKLVIVIIIAIAGYFGYDAVFTPKVVDPIETTSVPSDATVVDTNVVDPQ